MPFEPIEQPKTNYCIAPEHYPPSMYAYVTNQFYRYRCPACGFITEFYG